MGVRRLKTVADLALRSKIAHELLGSALDRDGFAPCPGLDRHTSRNGRRDFVVRLDGAPTAHCLHASCAEVVDAFNSELRRRVAMAERNGTSAAATPMLGADVPPAPAPPRASKRPPYDPSRLAGFAARCPVAVTLEWLANRSPVPVPAAHEQDGVMAAAFLSALYAPAARVLVFTRNFSQGDFLFEPARGAFRLAAVPAVRAVPSPLPTGAPEGVWWLVQPVTGAWLPNPNNRDASGNVQLGRRHASCVTGWPYLVLESDEAPADLWLRALVQLPFPIVAAYTSGGRSVHALVRVNADSKAAWDAMRDDLVPIVCPLGADGGALSAVRLSRLPGCLRHGKRDRDGKLQRYDRPQMQRLVWLNPAAPAAPILDLVPR